MKYFSPEDFYIKVGFIFLDFLWKEDVACKEISLTKSLGILSIRINLNFKVSQTLLGNFKIYFLYFFFKSSTYSGKPCLVWSASFSCTLWITRRGYTQKRPKREAPPEKGIFFRLQVYERVGISLVQVYEMVGKSIIWSVKWPKKATEKVLIPLRPSQ